MLSRTQTCAAGPSRAGRCQEILRIEEMRVLITVSVFCALALGIYIATFVVVLKG
ncbi:MAG: hypothetical protein IIC06_06740 [Proteobacteria bacterium]|nr:hypothetical protein [Pseudomonadota bacterium]